MCGRYAQNLTQNLTENHRTNELLCLRTSVYHCTLHLAIRGAQVDRCAWKCAAGNISIKTFPRRADTFLALGLFHFCTAVHPKIYGIAAREIGGSSAPEMGLALRLEIFVFRNFSAARAIDVPTLCTVLTSPSPLGERVPKAGEGLPVRGRISFINSSTA